AAGPDGQPVALPLGQGCAGLEGGVGDVGHGVAGLKGAARGAPGLEGAGLEKGGASPTVVALGLGGVGLEVVEQVGLRDLLGWVGGVPLGAEGGEGLTSGVAVGGGYAYEVALVDYGDAGQGLGRGGLEGGEGGVKGGWAQHGAGEHAGAGEVGGVAVAAGD